MTNEEAEELGRKMAKEDIEEGFIDEEGNILDEDALERHVRDQIICKVETTDFGLARLRQLLETVEGYRNDFIGVRYSSVLPRRLVDRFPEFEYDKKGFNVPLTSEPPDINSPFGRALRAYERYILDRRRK